MEIIRHKEPLTIRDTKRAPYLKVACSVLSNGKQAGTTQFILTLKYPGNKAIILRTTQCASTHPDAITKTYKNVKSFAEEKINELKGQVNRLDVYLPDDHKNIVGAYKSVNGQSNPLATNREATALDDALGHQGKWKAAIKHLIRAKGIDYAKGLLSETKAIIDNFEAEYQKEQAEIERKKKRGAELLAMMKREGISLEELQDPKVRSLAQKKVEITYQIIHEGQPLEWNGSGRTPEPFAQYMRKTGKSLRELAL